VTDTNVLKLVQPGTFSDLLTDVLRSGAHALLAQAVEAEPRFGGAFFALRKRTRAGLRQMTAFKGQLTHPRLWAKIPMPSSRKKRKEKFPV
jgi:hypothetical protein